jgi:Protein of unknown function (DUF3558)
MAPSRARRTMTTRLITTALTAAVLAGCGSAPDAQSPSDTPPAPGFRAMECNGVTDADITDAVGITLFTKVVDNDAGCFWQENAGIGAFGVGMGISTWWYRGSDLDTERTLERNVGRELTEMSLDGNKGFKAHDDNACSIYVAKGEDVITWSIQTMNPAMLPDLCSIAGQLAQLSQDRVN